MAKELSKLFITLGIDDKGLQKSLNKAQKTIGKWSKGMAVAGGAFVAAVSGISVASLKMAADFDSAMREVNTMMQLSEDSFQEFSNQVKDMSAALGVDAVESAQALYQAISAGVPKENAITFLQVATKAAIGGVTDTETAVDGLTTVLNAFKMSVSEAERVADLMFTTVKGGKTTFSELSESLYNVAPLAKASGVSIEEVTAALATMTKQGVPTTIATTQLRAAIQAMTAPTIRQEKHLKKLGLEMSKEKMETEGLASVMQELVEATGGDMAMLRKLIGSVEGVQAVLMLAGENADAFAADLDAMANSTGAATDAFNQMELSASRQMEALKSTIKDMAISIGNSLMPMLKQLIDTIKPIVEKVGQWISDNPELTKTILLVAGAIGGLLLGLGTLGMALPAIAAAFTALLGPVGLVIAGVAAVAAGIMALYLAWKNNWGNIRGITEKVVESIVHAVGWVWDKVMWYFENIAFGIAFVMKNIAKIVNIFSHDWAMAIYNAADLVSSTVSDFREKSVSALQNFDVNFQKTVEKTDEGADEIKESYEKISDVAEESSYRQIRAMEQVNANLNKLSNAYQNAFSTIVSAVGYGSHAIGDWMKSQLSYWGSQEKLNEYLSTIMVHTGTGWVTPERAEELGIERYQHGGIVPGSIGTPQLAVVEAGERILTPEQQTQVITIVEPFYMDGEKIAERVLKIGGERYQQHRHIGGKSG